MDGDVVEVLRARRFELVDGEDRVRARLVVEPRQEGGPLADRVGLELFDSRGSARGWLVDEGAAGVQLALAVGGNLVLILHAASPTIEVDGGVSIALCDPTGAVVLGWEVTP